MESPPQQRHTAVLVVGAGQAGAQLALRLRERGFEGSILVVGDEAALPYERPPLSKAYLTGEIGAEAIAIREPAAWAEANVEFLLGEPVDRLDLETRTARLGGGLCIDYDWCVLAVGAQVRKLSCPGGAGERVMCLRTLADVDRIKKGLNPGLHIAIVGAGYIGLEVAAATREAGHEVTVIEARDRVLARVTGPAMSEFYTRQHEARGVRFLFGEVVEAIENADRQPVVRLAGGGIVEADLVIVGIGIVPESGLAERSGIDCNDGILVDDCFRTSAPRVFAIGDCARHPNRFAEALWRLESVQHAIDSANVAADAILGSARCYDDVPWFWSDQYDLKLQTVGLAHRADEIVLRGDGAAPPFSVAYLREGRLVALDAVNSPRDFMAGRKLIIAGVSPDRALLADPSVPLKSLA